MDHKLESSENERSTQSELDDHKRDSKENLEKSKWMFALTCPSVVSIPLSQDFKEVKNPLEASKAFMTQLYWQMERFGRKEDKSEFKNWIQNIVEDESISNSCGISSFISSARDNTRKLEFTEVIQGIRRDIVDILGDYKNMELSVSHTDESDNVTELDGFLYENENNFLKSHGLCSVMKCSKCGSTKTEPIEALTHSSSTESMIQLFTFKLPNLDGKKLLDLGSGLGSILFGAYYMSSAAEITGIEINRVLCKLVNKVIAKYGINDRINIIPGNLIDFEELLKAQDVIICNNAFEYFQSEKDQIDVWEFLKSNLKPGCLFVTNPNLDVLLSPFLKCLSFEKNQWVTEIPPFNNDDEVLYGPDTVDEDFYIYLVK